MELSKLMGCVKRPFIPSELFRDGLIDGAWLDPSDMSTMFQDAAGTIPVTAVEQPVGLILDKSQGLMLGPELVTNGNFDSGITGWYVTGDVSGWSVVGGVATCTSTAVSNRWLNSSSGIEIGKTYLVSITATISAGVVATDSSGVSMLSNGSNVKIITAVTNVFRIIANAAFIGSIDNISVREIYGYHATQSVTASRPTLSARYNLLTKTEDFSNSAWVKDLSGTGAAPVVTTNYATAPDGSNTAARIVYALNGGSTISDFSHITQSSVVAANTNTTLGVWLKSTDGTTKKILISMAGEVIKLVDVGNNWLFVAHTMFRADTNYSVRIGLRGTFGTSDSADILIWHPDLRLGTTPGPYQRVNTVTDYDTNPALFPKYLKFDGIDDYLNLPYMGLYANGSASVVIGVTEFVQSANNRLFGESSTTTLAQYVLRNIPAGFDFVIEDNSGTFFMDMAETKGMNGSVYIMTSVDNGTTGKIFRNSNLSTGPYIYSRASNLVSLSNTTLGGVITKSGLANLILMNMYGLIVTKSALTDAQRVRCERFLAQKAGVML